MKDINTFLNFRFRSVGKVDLWRCPWPSFWRKLQQDWAHLSPPRDAAGSCRRPFDGSAILISHNQNDSYGGSWRGSSWVEDRRSRPFALGDDRKPDWTSLGFEAWPQREGIGRFSRHRGIRFKFLLSHVVWNQGWFFHRPRALPHTSRNPNSAKDEGGGRKVNGGEGNRHEIRGKRCLARPLRASASFASEQQRRIGQALCNWQNCVTSRWKRIWG